MKIYVMTDLDGNEITREKSREKIAKVMHSTRHKVDRMLDHYVEGDEYRIYVEEGLPDYVWTKTTPDIYELPMGVWDSASEMAAALNVDRSSIISSASHARERGTEYSYKRVRIKDV